MKRVIGTLYLGITLAAANQAQAGLLGIEWDTGNLYRISTVDASLTLIDLVTFATSNIADLPTIGGIGGLTAQGNLAYLATGLNAGGTNSLYSIDLFTGATSLIGGFGLSGNGISGLAVEPAETPEPATLALLGLGLLPVGATRRRR